MELILIVIGLLTVMWYAAKAFNKVGDVFYAISRNLEDRSLSVTRLKHDQEKATRRLEKAVSKLEAVKEEDAYNRNVREEIEKLTN